MKTRSPDPCLLALLVLALSASLGACCNNDNDTPEAGATNNGVPANAACPNMVDAQQRFGLSLGGTYGGATFAEYRLAFDASGTIDVIPPNSSPCAAEIAVRLEQTCQLCARSGGDCVALVGGVMAQPTTVCAICGDQICTPGAETVGRCAADCSCGDGVCERGRGEDVGTCPEDCGSTCGDRYCASPTEACVCPATSTDCTSCPQDCCRTVCGDGECEAANGEALLGRKGCVSDADCPSDLRCEGGRCVGSQCAVDGDCSPGKKCTEGQCWCEVDCGPGYCGDTICQPTENSATCPTDCAQFIKCGDGLCDGPETCFNCPVDCDGPATCFDGVCDTCEVWTCAADCDGVDIQCGDGECDGHENPVNCPVDCSRDLGACGDSVCDTTIGETRRTCAVDCVEAESTCDGYCSVDERTMDPGSCTDCTSCASIQGVACRGTESYCNVTASEGLFTAVVVDCGGEPTRCGSRPLETPCEGACRYSSAGATCTSCPFETDPELMAPVSVQLCPEGFEARCLGPTLLQTCVSDPTYSSVAGCEILTAVQCPHGCLEAACLDEVVETAFRIDAVTPREGKVGTLIAITGVALGTGGTVTFAPGVEGVWSSWTPTRIEVTVPVGARTGSVQVRNSDGEGGPGWFQVIDHLTVTGIEPTSGGLGTRVTLRGYFFGANQGKVFFQPGVEAPIQLWIENVSDDLAIVTVPAGARTGRVIVQNSAGQLADSPAPFAVLPSVPTNVHLSATEGLPDAVVTITGSNLGLGGEVIFWIPYPELEYNRHFGVVAEVVSWTAEQIAVRVPRPCGINYLGAETCSPLHSAQVFVRTSDGFGISAETFTLRPGVDTVGVCGAPTGRPNDLVEVRGYGFGADLASSAVSRVAFGGVEARIVAVEPARLWAVLPVGAQSGPVTVWYGEVPVQGPSFTVLSANRSSLLVTPMPDSATPFCTDGANSVDCATASPQDGTRIDPAPSLIVNGPVLTDLVTGLQWQRDASPPLDILAAQCACEDLSLGGHDDWRVPWPTELLTLADYGLPDTWAFGDTFALGGEIGIWTRFVEQSASRPIGFGLVGTNGFPAVYSLGENRAVVHCVREDAVIEPPAERFVLGADWFDDVVNGLRWQRFPSSASNTWGQALNACANLELAGQTEWRLPSLKEILSVADLDEGYHSVVPFEGFGAWGNYWTSTPLNQLRGGPNPYDIAIAFGTDPTGEIWTLRANRVTTGYGVVCVTDTP